MRLSATVPRCPRAVKFRERTQFCCRQTRARGASGERRPEAPAGRSCQARSCRPSGGSARLQGADLLAGRVLSFGGDEADAVALVLEASVGLPAAVLTLTLRGWQGVGVCYYEVLGVESGRSRN